MNSVYEFLRAALPWVAMLAGLAIGSSIHKEHKEDE